MSVDDIYQYMEEPSLLSHKTIPKLKQVIDKYPYFQSAKLLYLKNLAMTGDPSFESELKQMAVAVADRKKLFMMLEGERFGLQSEPLAEKPKEKEDSFLLIDNFLSSVNDEKTKAEESPLLFQPSVSADYLEWTQTGKTVSVESVADEEEQQHQLQHADLIDSFLQKEEERVSGKAIDLTDDDEAEQAAPPESVKELEGPHPKPLEDSYFTETLARIYVKQKRYDKAMQIIKNLSLKYPEKNVYFADQIRFLEKLIINTKK